MDALDGRRAARGHMLFSATSHTLEALDGQRAVLRTSGRTTPVTVTAVRGRNVTLGFPASRIAGRAILTCAHDEAGLITARGTIDQHGVLLVKNVECAPQRRSAFRVRVGCDVEVTLGDVQTEACTTDVSVTGLRLASCPRLRVGDDVELRIILGDDVLHARGRVARADRSGACGVRFVDLAPGDDQRLGSFLADLQREQLSGLGLTAWAA
jgi:hypothetical protein